MLRQRRGVQVGALLDQDVLLVQLARRGQPAEAHARAEDLGEGPQVDHGGAAVQRGQRRGRRPLEAELAVRVVLDHHEPVAGRDVEQGAAPLQAPGAPGRVLEVGHDVDELRPARAGAALELLGDHALVVGGDLDEARLVGLEGVDGADVGGALAQHLVALVEEELAGQVEALLRAGGDDDLRGLAGGAQAGVHAARDRLAQARMPLGGRVLQRLRALPVEHVRHHGLQLLDGEHLRGRQAAAEGDDLGPLGDLEQLADVRGLHHVQAPRESCCGHDFLLESQTMGRVEAAWMSVSRGCPVSRRIAAASRATPSRICSSSG